MTLLMVGGLVSWGRRRPVGGVGGGEKDSP